MKNKIKIQSVILSLGILFISCNPNNMKHAESVLNFEEITGPYLGQNPPGMTPEMFAPDLLSIGEAEWKITFSPDGMAFCYNFNSPRAQWIVEPTGLFKKSFMMFSHVENGFWTVPKEFSFNPELEKYYPFFSYDGKRMYFNDTKNGNPRMLYIERQNGGWSEPKKIEFKDGFQCEGLFISVAATDTTESSLAG